MATHKTPATMENIRLKKELSHVSWLLYETCRETQNNQSDINIINNYYYSAISRYGYPEVSAVYDSYYDGYWLKCVWGQHEHWLWMSTHCSLQHILNIMYWWDLENNKRNSEYIWDDYYCGWWIFSESKNDDILWIWWG